MTTMKKVIHRAYTRGHANHGWLDTHHTFSFANYFDPERVRFGALRVLNDDIVAPGMGFADHAHDNVEIVSILLEGELEHRDSLGNVTDVGAGGVQVLSAGTGITHSEYNKNADRPLKHLQIWFFPGTQDAEPRYQQGRIDRGTMKDRFAPVVTPPGCAGEVRINQDAWLHMAEIDAGATVEYRLQTPGHGLYIFIVRGEVVVGGEKLGPRDGMGVWDTDNLDFTAAVRAEVLVIEVPMD